ncbi:MAG: hypothetical protein LBP62_03360 [Clostridiales bacterium]|jgi:hypothetical protein|nr:hypothetical protein [Clostridiales bacterium]
MANDILLNETKDGEAGVDVARWVRFGIATLLLIGIVVALFFPFTVKYKVDMRDENGIVLDNETEVTFTGADVLVSAFDVLSGVKDSEHPFTKYMVNSQPLNPFGDFTIIALSRILPISLLLFLALFLADYIYLLVRIFTNKLKRGVNTFSVLQLVIALAVFLGTLLVQIIFGAVKAPGAGIIILAAVAVLTVIYQPAAGEHFPEKE